MDTACLKIKFTSLIKRLKKDDSTCCLEIIPQVSCLKNFDKMLWDDKENSLYEYVIPITYKIILKKYKTYDTEDAGHELKQVYHSCVDIFHASTTNSVDVCGDIPRIFSETLLPYKISASSHKWNITRPQPIKCYSSHEDKMTASSQTYEKTGDFALTGNSNVNKDYYSSSSGTDDSNKQYCVMHNIDVQVGSLEKSIMTMIENIDEKGTQRFSNKCNNKISYCITDIPKNSKKHNTDEKVQLSLAPICSIDTSDMLFVEKKENNCNPYSIFKNNSVAYYNNLVLHNYKAPIMKPIMIANYMPLNDFKTLEPYRNKPEVRIAKIMQFIEYEMLPIKFMLNDIVSKYTSLNVDDKIKKSLLATHESNQFQKCKGQNRLKSNRVIYTIVFDD